MSDVPETFSESDRKELQEVAGKGVAKLKEYLDQKNEEWKEVPLNIAIAGVSGTGKSSFFNAIRDIRPTAEGGAKVGHKETTHKVTAYSHPKYPSMVFWDLPGVGTPNFPRDTYREKVKFERYDFFLIMSSGRFRDDDLWLAIEVCKLKKNFHFVRTQIDVDVDKDRKSNPENPTNIEVLLNEIRQEYEENLKRQNITAFKVFLIDNYNTMNYDFPSLANTLAEEFPIQKRKAFVLSLSILTTEVIEKKVEVLKSRIYEVSLLSAIAGAIPIPGIGAAVDSAILLKEISFYKSELGIDGKSMDKNARLLHTEVSVLEKNLSLQSLSLATDAKKVIQTIYSQAVSESIESALPIVIPVIGCVLSAGFSYGVSVASLRYLLKCCSDDARKINAELMKHLGKVK